MARSNPRLEAARKAYREALEAARANPTSEAWARLLAAGKELSAAQEPKKSSRRSRRGGIGAETPLGMGGVGGMSEGTLDLDPTMD